MPTYKLTYFNWQGKGEPIRLLLTYMGEEFEDIRYERKDWPKLKSTTPFGKLPLLEVDGKLLTQSLAITRYLGKLAGLAGKNDWEALQVDMVVETLEDLIVPLIPYNNETDPEVKAKKRETLLKETIPFYLSKLDEQVKKNNGYLANGNLSWADIYFFGVSTFLCHVSEKNIFEKYSNFNVLKDNILAVPSIKSWVDKRPASTI